MSGMPESSADAVTEGSAVNGWRHLSYPPDNLPTVSG
jgi:hypothetical protein